MLASLLRRYAGSESEDMFVDESLRQLGMLDPVGEVREDEYIVACPKCDNDKMDILLEFPALNPPPLD